MQLRANYECDDEAAPWVAEALAEGLVLAAIEQIERSPRGTDAFACCCKCAGFRPKGLGPRGCWLPTEAVAGPEELVRSGGGNPLSLCVYQVAQARREGHQARVICDTHGRALKPTVEIDGVQKDVVAALYDSLPDGELDESEVEIDATFEDAERNCGCTAAAHDPRKAGR